jgi:hypothetical protein
MTRGARKQQNTNETTAKVKEGPENGEEFFFSNTLVKIYQVPMLFGKSSEEGDAPNQGAFICIIFEK